MTIGILTFHDTTNYGALLQAYALQQTIIKKFRCDCEIINYTCSNIKQRELPLRPKCTLNIKSFLIDYLEYRGRLKKKNNMRSFEKQLIKSEVLSRNDLFKVVDKYDKVFVGSDIVWEPDVTDNDLSYFLDFVPIGKRYSYAASFGNAYINDYIKDTCGELLSGFNNISVREKSGISLVKQVSNQAASLVLDPTLLIEANDWYHLISFKPKTNRYLLLYFLDDKGILLNVAKELSKKWGYTIVLIHSGIRPIKHVLNIRNCSVEEFLGWFRNASIILTSSYHGLAFALNFGIEFYYYNRAHSERMISLANIMDISDREIKSERSFKQIPLDNYKLQNKLLIEREKSLAFLDSCIDNY